MGKAQTKAVIWLALLLASSAGTFALDQSFDVSQYGHTAWKIREGFTKGTIFSTAQTPDGYLWLGTEFGLVRFDGVQAIPWQPPTGEQLPSTWIKSLLVARDGTLWIGTEKGLASWKAGKLTAYPEVAGQAVSSMLQDVEGTLWFGVRDPGRLCTVRAGKTQCYGTGSFGWSVSTLYEDRHGNLWVSAQTGLWRWAPGLPNRFQLLDRAVEAKALAEGDNGELLMATGRSGPMASSVTGVINGLKQLVGGKIRSYTLPEITRQFRPTCLFRSSDGSLWVGTVEGLLHLHHGRIDSFSVSDGLSGNFIRSIFEDREGSIWVSTEDGLDRFREFAVPTISGNEHGLSTSAVTVLQATADGSIWILTAEGLNRWQNGRVTVYGGKPSRRGQDWQTEQREHIANARAIEIANSGLRGAVYTLGQDDRGRLWAGGDEGVFYFDRGGFVQVPGVPGGNISSIVGGGQGRVWISSLDQSLFLSTPEGVAQRISWGQFGHPHGAVALLTDRLQSGLWLGFLSGGIAYLKDGQVLASYNVADGMGSGEVSDLQFGSDGAVWAATQGGLSRVKDGRVTTLTSKNGLPCNAVNWVVEDNDHSLWLYMSCGLVRIARSELDTWVSDTKRSVQITVYDSSDGVRSRALPGPYGRKVTESLDGKIWFSPPDGVSVIDPRHLPFNKVPAPVDIKQITADGKTYDASNGVRLPPRVHDLTIDYTALSLIAPEKVQFRFKLEGQDKDWREVVNQRRVEYSNLAPGNYRFRVKASNNSGVWNEEGASLDFAIAPAFYQTNWFRALCVAAFLAFFWAVYQARVRQLQYQESKLRAVIENIPGMVFSALPGPSNEFVSQGWREYTGLSEEETAGLGWQKVIHPEDLEQHMEQWRICSTTGKPYENEVRFRRAADAQYRWFLVRAVPFRDKTGQILKWYGVLTDIEDRKRAEEAQHRGEAYLAESQRLTHTGSWAYKGIGVGPVYWSEENFRIWEFDQQRGLPSSDMVIQRIHPEDRDRIVEHARKALSTGRDYTVEGRIVLPDGTVRHIQAVGHPVLDESGEVIEVLGTHIDITERKRAEQERERLLQLEVELAHKNRVTMLGELASSLAHEINQPISAIITSASASLRWLTHSPPDLERASAAVVRIERDGDRVAEIVHRLRLFYKTGAPPQRELVDINEAVGEMLVLLRNEATRHSISLRTELTPQLPQILADRVQIQQVLMNLMLNGIEAMKDGAGELSIRSQMTENGLLLVSVSDTGVGLPSEKVDLIFNAFYTTKPQGTGMGLAISRSIIEAHSGRLWATANVERGATFYFTVPVEAHR